MGTNWCHSTKCHPIWEQQGRFHFQSQTCPARSPAVAYDKAGNSTSTSISLTLDTASTSRFAYDSNGNMTQRTELGKTTLYTYDYDNRLTRVTSPQSQVASYAYDSLGRRTRKDDGRGTITKYVYDGANIIAEYTSTSLGAGTASGALLKKNLFGPGVDEILSTIDYGLSTTYYYHKDALGSITDITSSSGSTVESYSYWIGG